MWKHANGTMELGGTLTAPDSYARRERDRRRNPRAMPGHGEPRRERWDVEHVRE